MNIVNMPRQGTAEAKMVESCLRKAEELQVVGENGRWLTTNENRSTVDFPEDVLAALGDPTPVGTQDTPFRRVLRLTLGSKKILCLVVSDDESVPSAEMLDLFGKRWAFSRKPFYGFKTSDEGDARVEALFKNPRRK